MAKNKKSNSTDRTVNLLDYSKSTGQTITGSVPIWNYNYTPVNMDVTTVLIKKLDNFVALPEYKTEGAVAMDLYSTEDTVLNNGKVSIVPTGIAIAVPEGYEAQIRARSGLATKGVFVVNGPGTVDSDYRGEVKVLLSCLNSGIFEIKRGDRIAQLVISPVAKATLRVVENLDATTRGEGGIGSTGV